MSKEGGEQTNILLFECSLFYVSCENTANLLESHFFQKHLRVICDAVGDTHLP